MNRLRPRALRVLITAGPTREYLDPVRYLSNDSSGRMGFALARAAKKAGCSVTLVAGPVALPTPPGVKRVDVISAREMRAAVRRYAPRSNIIIMCAAVADWRPARVRPRKMKRRTGRSGDRTILLRKNPDILAEMGRRKRADQTLVGFALETHQLKRRAIAKLKAKNCDWIVANPVKNIGAKKASALLIGKGSERAIKFPPLPKEALAESILKHLL